MEKKLGLLFAIVFVVGIVSIASSPKVDSGDSQNRNVQTALQYLEQDMKNFEKSSDAKPSFDRLDYELLFGDTPPNPFLESEYVNPNFLRTYELYPTSPFFDQRWNGVSWLPWNMLDKVPPGSLILGPYVEPCPEFHTGFRDVEVTRTELFK